MALSDEMKEVVEAFTEGLWEILGRKLYSAYVYGAAAFPDTLPTGDIDFHVVLAEPLTDSERSDLEAFHSTLALEYPAYGGEFDGYYILLDDAKGTAPPRSQLWARAVDESWALHREHVLAGRRIVLHGPDPSEFLTHATGAEIEAALDSEFAYVEQHIVEVPAYGVLNLCRLIRSFETGQVVVSKDRASRWAMEALPAWRNLIEAARKAYMGQTTEYERRQIETAAPAFLDFAAGAIAEKRVEARRLFAGDRDHLRNK